MISCIRWVPKGIPASAPTKQSISAEDFERFSQMAKSQLSKANEYFDGKRRTGTADEIVMETETVTESESVQKLEESLQEFNLDSYDQDSDDESPIFKTVGRELHEEMMAQEEDQEQEDAELLNRDFSDEEEELDAVTLRVTDNMIFAGKTEDEVSYLEAYVYDTLEDQFYVHHDIMLPAVPLCIESIRHNLSNHDGKNFCAVGTFDPEIEIWDMDILDPTIPSIILQPTKKSKKQDPTLSLAWSPLTPTNLISTSTKVNLWDISTASLLTTLNPHKRPIACCHIHRTDATTIVTGSYDQSIAIMDIRAKSASNVYQFTGDVECAKWSWHQEWDVIAAVGNDVSIIDSRMGLRLTVSAHTGGVTCVDESPFVPGLVVSGSVDGAIKVWDVQGEEPRWVTSKEDLVGKIFSVEMSPDSPYDCIIGGSGKEGSAGVAVWNITDSPDVRTIFEGRSGRAGLVRMDGPGSVQLGVKSSGADDNNEKSEDESETEMDVADLYGK